MKQKNYLTSLLLLCATVAFVGCSATRYSRSTGEYIDDKATYGRVKTALAKDSLVKAADIKVRSFRGNVQLTGFVDHPAQKERASQLVRNTRGVDWFKNDIVVKGQLPGEIQRSASEQMDEPAGANRDSSYNYNQRQQQQRFSSSSSRSSNGAAMKSDANWHKGALNVYDPAAEISVHPSSSVKTTGESSSQGVSAGASVGGVGASAGAGISSEASGSNNDLTQRIQTQLRSDNSASAQQVRVETSSNGAVTLRGTVSSESEKQSLESKVKAMPGVNQVDNQLEVRNK